MIIRLHRVLSLYLFLSGVASVTDDEAISGAGELLESQRDEYEFRVAVLKRSEIDSRHREENSKSARLISHYDDYIGELSPGSGDSTTSGRVRRFCRRIRQGCSYQEAYVLLGHDSARSRHRTRSFDEEWRLPSDILLRAMPSRGQHRCRSIHHTPTSKEFYEDYVSKGVPVIIRGGVSIWPAVSLRKWSLQYLMDRVGNDTVKVYVSPNSDFEAPTTMGTYRSWLSSVVGKGNEHSQLDNSIDDTEPVLVRPAETEFSFPEYAYLTKNYSNPERAVFYLQKHPLKKWEHSGLLDDLLPSLFDEPTTSQTSKRKRVSSVDPAQVADSSEGWARFLAIDHWFLWMGEKFSRGNLHYDAHENLHALVKGSKTFELYHPFNEGMYDNIRFRTAHFLYDWKNATEKGKFWSLPVTASSPGYQPFSPVNTTHPNFKVHPRFNDKGNILRYRIPYLSVWLYCGVRLSLSTVKLICNVNAGDIIYIPSNWWHEVISRGDSEDDLFIGVNAFFHPW